MKKREIVYGPDLDTILDDVASGETYELARDGIPVAVILPPADYAALIAHSCMAGPW